MQFSGNMVQSPLLKKGNSRFGKLAIVGLGLGLFRGGGGGGGGGGHYSLGGTLFTGGHYSLPHRHNEENGCRFVGQKKKKRTKKRTK